MPRSIYYLRALALVAATTVLTACPSAKLVSTHVPAPSAGATTMRSDGFFYTLPRTVVQVTLPVTLTVSKAGPLAEFSALFVPGRRVLSSGKKLSIGQTKFATVGEPDPDQVYQLMAEGKRGAIKQNLTFAFSEQGAVTGLKAEVTDQTADIILAAVSGITGGIASTAFGAGGKEPIFYFPAAREPDCGNDPTDANKERHFEQCFLGFADEKRVVLVERFELMPNSVREPYLEAYMSRDPSGDPVKGVERRLRLDRALDIYDRVAAMILDRNDVLSSMGAAPPGLAAALEAWPAQIASLQQQFLGKKQVTPWTAVFKLRPERVGNCHSDNEVRTIACQSWTSGVLLKYAPTGAICRTMDLEGAVPPPARMKTGLTENDPACTHELKVKLELDPADQPVTRIAGAFGPPEVAGLHYIVPAQMRAKLITIKPTAKALTADAAKLKKASDPAAGGKIHLMIAQLGIVAAMPTSLGGKALTYDLKFYDASGALKSFALVSTPALEAGMVNSLSSSANAMLDARNKQREAAEASGDELNQLMRQKDILDAMLAIQKACAELDPPPESCGG